MPLKIKLFLWQMFRDKLPTSLNVAKRNGPASGPCALCGTPEDANHVFFGCSLARFAWSAVRTAAGVQWDPRSAAELVHILDAIQGPAKRVVWSCVGALFWALWLTRNKLTIEHIFPTNPVNCLFKAIIFLQQWRSLIKDGDLEAFDDMLSRMKSTASTLLRHSRRNLS